MKKIGLIGYGDLSKQLINLIATSPLKELTNKEIIIFDDLAYQKKEENSFPLHGYKNFYKRDISWIVCLGYKHLHLKHKIISELLEKGEYLPSLIHPSSFIDASAKIGSGTYIYPGCLVDMNVTIGNGVLLNIGIIISHDSIVGDCSYLSPGTTLSGKVKVGKSTFLGTRSSVSNSVDIGDNCIIGIGSCVTHGVTKGSHAIGNPLRILKNEISLD